MVDDDNGDNDDYDKLLQMSLTAYTLQWLSTIEHFILLFKMRIIVLHNCFSIMHITSVHIKSLVLEPN